MHLSQCLQLFDEIVATGANNHTPCPVTALIRRMQQLLAVAANVALAATVPQTIAGQPLCQVGKLFLCHAITLHLRWCVLLQQRQDAWEGVPHHLGHLEALIS